MNGEEDESGATATAVFIGDDKLLVSHVGDSSVVCIINPYCSPRCYISLQLLMKKCTSLSNKYEEKIYDVGGLF